jgi:hypothetical protein
VVVGGAASGVDGRGRRRGPRLGARGLVVRGRRRRAAAADRPDHPAVPILDLAADRETIIVLTNPWHERDGRSLSERRGAPVFAPPPDDDGTGIRMPAQLFTAGDRLSFGVEVFPGREPPYDVLLWIESHRAVAIGDTLIDCGHGIELLESWLAEGVTREQVVEDCARCSSSRSSTSCRPMARPPTERPSSAHSPDPLQPGHRAAPLFTRIAGETQMHH